MDKKLQYQVEKLMRAANTGSRMVAPDVKENEDKDDPLQYKPNPDMIVRKIEEVAQVILINTSFVWVLYREDVFCKPLIYRGNLGWERPVSSPDVCSY